MQTPTFVDFLTENKEMTGGERRGGNGSSKADRGKPERKEKLEQVWLQLERESFGSRQEPRCPCRLGQFGSERRDFLQS